MSDQSFQDLLPLFPEETEDAIRARWDSWANEGLAADDENRVDTREGSVFFVLTQPGVREAARWYDRAGTEVVAASTPLFAFGSYLDDHAEAIGLERTAATFATGIVTFTGTDGTAITEGQTVATLPASLDDDPVEFQTDVAAVISGGSVDVAVTAAVSGAAGNVAVGAITDPGVLPGVSGVTNADRTVGGADTESDSHLLGRILDSFRNLAPANQQYYVRLGLEQDGVGRVTVIPLYAGPGTVLVILMTEDGGPVSDQTVLDFQDLVDPPTFSTSLTADVASGSSSLPVVSTDGSFTAPGFVELGDEVLGYSAVTGTAFTLSGTTGADHVSGDPVVQRQGGVGQGGPGAYIKVMTSSLVTVTVGASVSFEAGYSLDGTASTVALRALIVASITEYIASRPPGSTVFFSKVQGAIADVHGVENATAVTLNGGTVDVVLSASPPESPEIVAPVLTEV